MKNYYTIPLLLLFSSCGETQLEVHEEIVTIHDTLVIYEMERDTAVSIQIEPENLSYFIHDRLPTWFVMSEHLKDTLVADDYVFDNRLNPLYLEEDFNGDGHFDVAIPVRHLTSQKVGFAIAHGGTGEIYFAGAGTTIKNGLSDDMNYIDIWRVNRSNQNTPGLDEDGNTPEGFLLLENPSIEILKSELGGGLIYWNGTEYAYFHQTC